MHFVLLLLLIALVIYGPQWWVSYTLRRYHQEDDRFPGTGGEFARHLLNQYQLQHIQVEVTDQGDHYDPRDGAVRLTADKHQGKSLTAVVVAAHEVGHALQHAVGYGPFLWRQRLVYLSLFTERLGSLLLFVTPLLALATRAPSAGVISFISAAAILSVGLLVQLVTLPVEWDASFGRALPVLRSGYLDRDQMPGARKILKACALTYVASSLVGLLNFWRWVRLLKR